MRRTISIAAPCGQLAGDVNHELCNHQEREEHIVVQRQILLGASGSMIGGAVGTENAGAVGQNPAGQMGRRIVQDNEIDGIGREHARERTDEIDSCLESLPPGRKNANVQQHGNVHIALAMGGPARVAAEQIPGNEAGRPVHLEKRSQRGCRVIDGSTHKRLPSRHVS